MKEETYLGEVEEILKCGPQMLEKNERNELIREVRS